MAESKITWVLISRGDRGVRREGFVFALRTQRPLRENHLSSIGYYMSI